MLLKFYNLGLGGKAAGKAWRDQDVECKSWVGLLQIEGVKRKVKCAADDGCGT